MLKFIILLPFKIIGVVFLAIGAVLDNSNRRRIEREKQQFYGGDGIVTKGVDKTVINVGRLAREGMRETDKTILEIMLSDGC